MKPRKDILIGVVVGADRAATKGGTGKGKWTKPQAGVVTICIGRPGAYLFFCNLTTREH
jgi:hypothetical protein